MTLYHYFERSGGPLRNLSDLPPEEARRVLDGIRAAGSGFAASRAEGYLSRRLELEKTVRAMFISKGGAPRRKAPHYFVVERCPWLETWYSDAAHIALAIGALDPSAVSFTYGDMFPTFSPRVADGREYRGQVYTHAEILPLIEKYGLPQRWNPDGARGPERYIEAQVWCDLPPELLMPEGPGR